MRKYITFYFVFNTFCFLVWCLDININRQLINISIIKEYNNIRHNARTARTSKLFN